MRYGDDRDDVANIVHLVDNNVRLNEFTRALPSPRPSLSADRIGIANLTAQDHGTYGVRGYLFAGAVEEGVVFTDIDTLPYPK